MSASGAQEDRSRQRGVLDSPRELLAMAAEALGRYRLRTFLSILGVILGVAAVIAMMSVSEGARRESLQQVEMLGLDNLVARSRTPADPSAPIGGLTLAEAERLAILVPSVVTVSPLRATSGTASHGGRSVAATVLGVRSTYQIVLRLQIGRGRFLSAVDDRAGARVCVVGSLLRRQLFTFAEPIGKSIRLQDGYCTVVGVLAEQGSGTVTGGALAWRDINTSVFIPLSVLIGRDPRTAALERVDEIWLQVDDGNRVEGVAQILDQTLARMHRRRDDFDVIVPRELLAQRYRTQRTFSVVVGSIAVIALLVGGIGIMNIMLTSVVERTHEIGIRRTIGATRRDVTAQFLAESLLMTVSGGLFGIVLGAASAMTITAYAGWNTFVSPAAVAVAMVVSMSVGLGFGLYPAMKAARLEPIDAVRYE